MLKLVCAFLVTLFTAVSVMAQDIPLPGPGGPNDRPPMPPPSTVERPPVITPPPSSGSFEPLPGQPVPPDQIGNGSFPNTPRIYVMGSANPPRRGSRDFVFYPDNGYDLFEVVGIVSTSGQVRINSIIMTFKDGRHAVAHRDITGVYRPNEGRMWVYLANNVASIIVNATDAGGNVPASFRVDVKALRSSF